MFVMYGEEMAKKQIDLDDDIFDFDDEDDEESWDDDCEDDGDCEVPGDKGK